MTIQSLFDHAAEQVEKAFPSDKQDPFQDAKKYLTDFLFEAKKNGVIDSFRVVDRDYKKGRYYSIFTVDGVLSAQRYAQSRRVQGGDFFIALEKKAGEDRFSMAFNPMGTAKILDIVAEKLNKDPINHGPLRMFSSIEQAEAKEFLADIAEVLTYSAQYYQQKQAMRITKPGEGPVYKSQPGFDF